MKQREKEKEFDNTWSMFMYVTNQQKSIVSEIMLKIQRELIKLFSPLR